VHVGEVGTEIAPLVGVHDAGAELRDRIDGVLRRACAVARALTGAEQAALALSVEDDSSKARKYFSLSEKYSEYRDFRVDPQGTGLHGMVIPPGEVVRLTQAEVESHPLWENFRPVTEDHPPMRGWLATSVCGDDGRRYGLLQLSDKAGGGDFSEADAAALGELAALVGETLDALRGASRA
jgi:GAF domain-containing protein